MIMPSLSAGLTCEGVVVLVTGEGEGGVWPLAWYPASVNIRQSSGLAAQQQFPAKEDIFKSLTGAHQHQHQHRQHP